MNFENFGCVGNILKIEKIVEKSQANLTLEKRPKMSHFQFKFDPYRLVYAGEITDMALSELPSQRIDGSVIDDILVSHMSMVDRIEMGTDVKNKNSEDIEIVLDKNEKIYSQGIRLLRLYNNKIGEPEELKNEENEEDDAESDNKSENKQDSLFQQRDSIDDDDEEYDLDNTFKSRKAFNQLINDQSVPSVIRNLKYGANILLLILIAISFSDYFVTYGQFNVNKFLNIILIF